MGLWPILFLKSVLICEICGLKKFFSDLDGVQRGTFADLITGDPEIDGPIVGD